MDSEDMEGVPREFHARIMGNFESTNQNSVFDSSSILALHSFTRWDKGVSSFTRYAIR